MMSTDTVGASPEILNSWKEIAAYLNRGVRTVQRWEAALNLPVRRPRGRQRSAVIALRSDLDQWLQSCPLHEIAEEARNGTAARVALPIIISNRELLLASRALREDVHRSRVEVSVSIGKLVSTLGKMMGPHSEVA